MRTKRRVPRALFAGSSEFAVRLRRPSMRPVPPAHLSIYLIPVSCLNHAAQIAPATPHPLHRLGAEVAVYKWWLLICDTCELRLAQPSKYQMEMFKVRAVTLLVSKPTSSYSISVDERVIRCP